MREELKFLIDISKQASELIADDFSISRKVSSGFYDLVTDIDYKVEEFLIDKINKNYPSFDIISEEYNSNTVLTKNCFTIDPIDGTINFAKKIPLWSIQLCCIKDGETIASVIYIPKTNELFYAEKDKGAFLNGVRLKISELPLNQSTVFVECNLNKENKKLIFDDILKISAGIRKLGSISVSFAYLAAGRFDAGAFLSYSPWDVEPGKLLIKEAGGIISNINDKYVITANSEENFKALNTLVIKYL